MKFTQKNLDVATVASKEGYQQEIACVFFRKTGTVATDRYKLVEVPTIEGDIDGAMKGFDPFLIEAKELARIKLPKGAEFGVKHLDKDKVILIDSEGNEYSLRRHDGQFPDYERLTQDHAGTLTVAFTISHIEGLLKAMKRGQEQVTLTFGGSDDIVIANMKDGSRGFLMPVRQ